HGRAPGRDPAARPERRPPPILPAANAVRPAGGGLTVADALASREELVRQADRHQRQGRNDLAIGIYERPAGQTPTDWNVVKQLADLCERAGQREAAAARFLQLADHYFEEGF